MNPSEMRPRSRSPNFQTETTNMLSDQLLGNLEAKLPYEKNDNSFIKYRMNHTPLIGPFLERKRWRCVSCLIVVMIILALFQGVLMFFDFLLSSRNDHPKIEKQNYQPVKYIGIPSNVTTELNQEVTKIFHVTKEFGLASMGGLGHIVTGLSQAQTANSALDVNVIMPFYSFLKLYHEFRSFAQMSIDIKDKYGNSQQVVFLVNYFYWNVTQDDADILSDEPPPEPRAVKVFVIGPDKNGMEPFNLAFESDGVIDIYSTPPGLPQEWKDLYFCKAVAELIAYINNNVDTPLFATQEEHGVDVIHIHGATNALVVEFIKDLNKGNNRFSKPPPAIVYTLHDYLEEQLYSNEVVNILKFMDLKNYTTEKPNYFHGSRMYTSSLAIDQADYVTFVSYTMAKEMVEGPMDFYLKELIMPSILERAKTGNWIGITNGIDLTSFNPFNDSLLIEANSNFPKNIYTFNPNALIPGNIEERRFQYNKGVQFFYDAAQIISQLNAKFIIMGQHNSYPVEKIATISKEYPDDVVVISDLEFQKNWGSLYRAAADILFVPSLTESFGLVAVEGLLFGAPVVSTGAGGLKEFLKNKTHNEMRLALSTAINDIKGLSNDIRGKEIFLRKLIKDALSLDWNKPGGAVDQYAKGNSQSLNLNPSGSGKDDKNKDEKDKDKKKKWEPPLPTRVGKRKRRGLDAISKLPAVFPTTRCHLKLLKMERIKDYLLMEEEFVQNQERLKPQEEKAQEERIRVDDLRGSPMGVGTLEEIIDDDHAIVSSSTGPEYYVNILSFVDKDSLEPGCSILLHHRAMSVVGVLQDDTDPMVSVMKLEKAPTESYADIGGLEQQIQEIKESVELPLTHPELYEEMGIKPPKGVILYGVPGTGKTLLAKAVANQTSATFLRVVGSELIQKYLGDGPKLVRELFRVAEEHAPSIVFIDEIDAIGTKREIQRTMLELLNQLDGFDSRGDVKVVMATNRIESLDPALIRPGRIDRKIEFPLPDITTKRRIFNIHTSRMTLSPDVDLEEFVMSKDDLSGADIKAICTEAGLLALRERRMKVIAEDLRKAREKVLYRKSEGTPEEKHYFNK
ncbi:10578_t:CDS:10 [Entrophospora sp. SA101]|nr:10578_t:CDS:10 [Entrophospora sp. SA101]